MIIVRIVHIWRKKSIVSPTYRAIMSIKAQTHRLPIRRIGTIPKTRNHPSATSDSFSLPCAQYPQRFGYGYLAGSGG